MNLTELYLHNFRRAHDINEHLPYLAGLALDKTVVELGFRTGRSTSAFLMGGAKFVTVYNTDSCTDSVKRFEALTPDRFKFIRGNSLKVTIPPCDILFIDSYHSGEQLLQELKRHTGGCRMVVLHDTMTFGDSGEGNTKGLSWAVRAFTRRQTLQVVVHFPNNNGLTVLA
jgi:hypothetical protein